MWGVTPLILAAHCGHVGTVKYLLFKGADIETQDDGKHTPLYWASRWGHTKVIKTLLHHGANREIRNYEGKTAEDEAMNDETRAVFSKWEERGTK